MSREAVPLHTLRAALSAAHREFGVARKTTSSSSRRSTKASKASSGAAKPAAKTAGKTAGKIAKAKTSRAAAKPAPVARSAGKQAAVRRAPKAPAPARQTPPPAAAENSREHLALQAVLAGQRLTDAQLRKAKSGLSRKQLADFRQLLFDKRRQLMGDVASLQNDVNEKAGNLSNMPLHMADVGSDHYEQEFSLGLMESDRKTLREIDAAILRIASGTYGVCMMTGLPIGAARLEAKPWARYCIEVVREREKRGQFE